MSVNSTESRNIARIISSKMDDDNIIETAREAQHRIANLTTNLENVKTFSKSKASEVDKEVSMLMKIIIELKKQLDCEKNLKKECEKKCNVLQEKLNQNNHPSASAEPPPDSAGSNVLFGQQTSRTKHFLKVVPKNKDDLKSSEATRQLIESMDLSQASVGVKKIVSIHDNGVSILCRNQTEVEALKETIDTWQLDLETKVPEKQRPVFTFWLRGKDFDQTKLISDIKSKNVLPVENDAFKIVYSRTTENGNTVFYLEVSPQTYQAFLRQKLRLFIGWKIVSLREQDPTSQCFCCWRYGHKKGKCPNRNKGKRCAQCGGYECNEVCSKSLCCPNCSDINLNAADRQQNQLETNHSATDKNCYARLRAFSRARANFDYGY